MPVTITRTAWIDDDGSGTTGTVINNAEKTLLYNQIDEGFAQLLPVQTPAMGYPIDHPFNAADYTAASPMTWTVSAGNVPVNTYSIVGKLVTWIVHMGGATLGGTASTTMTIRLPGGLSAAKGLAGRIGWLEIGAEMPVQYGASGATGINITRPGFAAFPLGTVYMYFTIQFWI
jgi:hypothetical protein